MKLAANKEEFRARGKRDSKTKNGWAASTGPDMQDEMDSANQDDETKWLLPANMADQPHPSK
jgi:hypothetical protein